MEQEKYAIVPPLRADHLMRSWIMSLLRSRKRHSCGLPTMYAVVYT